MATLITGNGIPLYRLMVMRSAVKLESKGMKMSRGVSWTKVARQEFGLPARAPHAQVLEAVEAAIAGAERNLGPGDIVSD